MDKTIELSDSSADGTINLDDTNKTIDLESSVEIEDKTASDHYVTAASNTKFLETPKITSTPNVQPPPLRPPNGVFLQVSCFSFLVFTAIMYSGLYFTTYVLQSKGERNLLFFYLFHFPLIFVFNAVPKLSCFLFHDL